MQLSVKMNATFSLFYCNKNLLSSSLFNKLTKQTNHSLLILVQEGVCCLTECLTRTFWLTARDART